ncbi:MAG: hypothetical protein ACOC6B_04105 [Thermodesulfobacteriota bacterium]
MDIHKIHNNPEVTASSSRTVRGGNGFKRVFHQKMNEINSPAVAHGTAALVEKSEKLLSLLETYAKGLADPRVPLSDIEPLAERIKEEAGSLEAEASEKASHDRKLENLIKEVSVTANVAALKFHRGDFS